MTYSHVTKLEKWAPIETNLRQLDWWKLCGKWVDPCGELFSGTRAFVKLSLYAPSGGVHSGNFTPDLPSASCTSRCGPPQLGRLGNGVEASAAVGSSTGMFRLLTVSRAYVNYTQRWTKAWRILRILSSLKWFRRFLFFLFCLTATISNLAIFQSQHKLLTINVLFQRDGLHSVLTMTEGLTGIHISQRLL